MDMELKLCMHCRFRKVAWVSRYILRSKQKYWERCTHPDVRQRQNGVEGGLGLCFAEIGRMVPPCGPKGLLWKCKKIKGISDASE